MDRKEFITQIKAKYPAYADVDDAKLFSAMKEKYPEYKEHVSDWEDQPSDSMGTSALVGAGQGLTANTLGHLTQKAIDVTDSLANSDNLIASYIGEQFGGKRGKAQPDVSTRLKQVEKSNPGVYATGEVAGSILSPTGKIGAIPKVAKAGATIRYPVVS